jgi:endonuclease/exonuclease/phosphatase family metal-dependent hydrolase
MPRDVRFNGSTPASHVRPRIALFLLAIVCLAPATAGTFSVASYNVENYLITDRMTENGFRKEYPKPEIQKRALRKVILGMEADVLVLEEMGTREYLDELQRDLKVDGLDYAHVALVVAADPDRHVALMSKLPILSVVQHTALAFDYFDQRELVKRGMLEAVFTTPAGNLTLFGVHLKSRFTDRVDDPLSASRRLGEATAVRDLVLKRFPDPEHALFAIVGDFNDDKSSKPLQRLMQRGKLKIAELLPAADSRGETWTHAYRKQDIYSRVDHILVSPALFPHAVGTVARIYDGDGILEASDHRPVMVTLSVSEKK